MIYDSHVAGKTIRKLRRKKGLSQEVLSGLADVQRSHLSMIEQGHISASMETLCRITEALEIRFSDFVRMVEEQK